MPYTGLKNKLDKQTVAYFNLESEQELTRGQKVHKYDHITQNILLAANINHHKLLTQTFKKSVLDKSNSKNLKIIKENNEVMDATQRNMYLYKFTKWDRFREQRKYYIDLYIKLRRKQQIIDTLVKACTTH